MDKVWLLDTEGKRKEVKPKSDKGFTLEEVYALLGCDMIEAVTTPDFDMVLLIDEEGKFKDNEINLLATSLVKDYLRKGDFIVGKALYCPRELFK